MNYWSAGGCLGVNAIVLGLLYSIKMIFKRVDLAWFRRWKGLRDVSAE